MSKHLSSGSQTPFPSAPDLADREWTGAECARALFRQKGKLAWITACGAIAAALITAAQPRRYESRAAIEVQGINENFLNLGDVSPTAPTGGDATGVYLQTQVEILRQDDLMELVAKKLGLAERPEFGSARGFWDKWKPRNGRDSSSVPALRNSVEALKKNIRIEPVRNSRIVEIVGEARNAPLAADIANTLAHTFIEQTTDARQRAAQQVYETLALQLESFRKGMLRSDALLGSLASGHALRPDVDANRRLYAAMLQKVNDARMASAVRHSNIRLINPARPAHRPFRPNVPLNLAIGTFGGLVLAIGAVMLREQTHSVLRTPGEAGSYLTLPELGAIPKATTRHRFPGTNNGKLHVERAILEERSSDLSESFRTILASILSTGRNGDHARTLVVTSSRPDEGKTTVVSNLGIALAEISSKVLLIDGDMRSPRLHRVFDQANSWGFSDVLREKNAIDELPMDVLVKKTPVPHLYLLPSGACADNIFALLHSGRISRLLARFRQEFDYVLVDAPPCLEFADARIMARHAEQLLLVVRANYTDRTTAQAAVQRLLLDGLPVMGVILNRWDPTRADRYTYRLNPFRRQGLL